MSINNIHSYKIMITRPLPQARVLAKKLERLLMKPIIFPAIDIMPIDNSAEVKEKFSQLKKIDLLIFISANAVDHAYNYSEIQTLTALPVKIAGIGMTTVKALQKKGLYIDYLPSLPFNSESFLMHPGVQDLDGQSVLIVRGKGGRDHLAEHLRQRGAQVDYAEVYRRDCPKTDITPILMSQPDIVLATSNEILQNIYTITPVDFRSRLLSRHLIVVSKRAMALAKELGFKHKPYLATGADDDALITCLQQKALRNFNSS